MSLLLSGLLAFGANRRPALSIGDPLPDFTLKDQYGNSFHSSSQIGQKIMVIYFYPKDETPGCTLEACTFRDSFTSFTEAGALVIGINSGSPESHKRFSDHHRLPFILLSDPGNKVLRQFGVRNKFIFTGRETFVADLRGKIAFTFNSFTQGDSHAQETLRFIRELANTDWL